MIRRRSKYGAVRSTSSLVGRTFDSRVERDYCELLRLREVAGDITSLRFQVTFRLEVNGLLICSYRADAVYNDRAGKLHVADVKGVSTDLYRVKRRLMKACLGIEVEEVRRDGRDGWTVR